MQDQGWNEQTAQLHPSTRQGSDHAFHGRQQDRTDAAEAAGAGERRNRRTDDIDDTGHALIIARALRV